MSAAVTESEEAAVEAAPRPRSGRTAGRLRVARDLRIGTRSAIETSVRSWVLSTEVALYRLGGVLAPRLPPSAAEAMAAGVSHAGMHLMNGRREMLARHMRRALGPEATVADVDRAAERAFHSYTRYWLDTFRLPALGPVELETLVDFHGFDEIVAARERGRGAIFALPHLGNWEAAGAAFVAKGFPLTAVVERLEPPKLHDWFVRLRSDRLGIEVLAVDDPRTGHQLMTRLRQGECVALLADRDLSGTGVEVEFFGERTTLPSGPARLAMATGAALLPVGVYERGPLSYTAVIRPPLQRPVDGRKAERVHAMTQTLAWELEGLIRRAPDQWHLLQPNWPSDHISVDPARGPAPGHGIGGPGAWK